MDVATDRIGADSIDRIAIAETFPQLIRAVADRYGEAPAVILSSEGVEVETLSFARLERASAELARGLLAMDVGKGSRVGIIAGNGPFFATAFAAVARMGGIAVPISTTIRANELVRVLRQSDIGGLVMQRSFLTTDYVQRLVDALPDLATSVAGKLRIPAAPYLRWIATTGEDLPPSMLDLGAVTAGSASVDEALLVEVESEVTPSDQLVEIYTSGSMALPKGVRHNHGPVLFRTHYLRGKMAPQEGQKLPAALPMFWVGGLMMALLPNLSAGAATVCTEKTLRNSRMAMGSVLQEDDIKAMAGMKMIWGLGMSETLGPYSYSGGDLRAPGYPLCAPMDHIADGYEIRVADAENRPVPEGENGEIQIRGYGVTPGLHKIPRDHYFTADGFYHTGDMGFYQGSRLLFTGRNGDMIKTAGSNVSPAEVEYEMQQLPGIQAAYVLGLPDQERGQIVVAAVVVDEPVDFGAVEATLRQRLSSYKVPRAYVAISREEVPMLHSNKVARREVAAMLEERLGRKSPGA